VFRDFNGQPLNGGEAQTGAAPEFKDNLWFGLTSNIFTASLFDPTNHNENLNPELGGISRNSDVEWTDLVTLTNQTSTSLTIQSQNAFFRIVERVSSP